MKTFITTSLLSAIIIGTSYVSGHGMLTTPTPRPITPAFRAELPPGMQTLADHELQRYPFQYMSPAEHAEYPNVYIPPCRGIPYSGQDVQTVSSGQSMHFGWTIDALHQGFCDIYLVTPQGSSLVKHVEPCAIQKYEGTDITVPQLPDACTSAGNCYFEWYWKTGLNNEDYSNCVDIMGH